MSANSNIEWTDHTFNPWMGCTKVSPACDNCYAEVSTPSRTLGVTWGAGQERRRTSSANWALPKRWNAQADAFMAKHGRRQRVFCASLADVFDNEVPAEWRADLFKLIVDTPSLDWLLLTKRIGNVARMIPFGWQDFGMPPNVWLGATIPNQAEADRDIPKLLATPARVRFLSMEPLLGPVDLRSLPMGEGEADCLKPDLWETEIENWRDTSDDWKEDFEDWYGISIDRAVGPMHARIDWVIVGGESGTNARPMHPDWARSLRDQCEAAGVPFLFKQWGEFDLSYDRDRDDPDYRRCNVVEKQPGRWINLAGGHGFSAGERVHYAHKVGKKIAGRQLDGVQHDGYPA